MELSRGDKQKQTDWPNSATREKLSKFPELLQEADAKMDRGMVHIFGALSMAFRKAAW